MVELQSPNLVCFYSFRTPWIFFVQLLEVDTKLPNRPKVQAPNLLPYSPSIAVEASNGKQFEEKGHSEDLSAASLLSDETQAAIVLFAGN